MDDGLELESDVIVIGAGMAGLTAACDLAREGLAVALLEARDFAGGRVITAHLSGYPFPIELGAEFVHGRPEPTLQLAREARVELVPLGGRHLIRRGGQFDDMAEVWQTLGELFRHADLTRGDQSVAELLRQSSLDPDLRELCRDAIEGFEAAPSAELGVAGIFEDVRAAVEGVSYLVQGGYRTLVSYLESAAHDAGVSVHLNCPVARVDWLRSGGVSVHTLAGRRYQAAQCVVTVPLGVLGAAPGRGGIEFEPALTPLRGALERLRPGHALKTVLCFDDAAWLARWPANADFLHLPGELFNVCWRRASRGLHQLTVWAGGPHALELERRSRSLQRDLALRTVALLFGESEAHVRSALVDVWQHDFSADPAVRGAYSYARVGGGEARRVLSQPLSGRLFFAGEATDPAYPGTVAGAIASGHRACQRVFDARGSRVAMLA